MTEYKCLESINSLYVDKDDSGYFPIPCCLYKDRTQAHRVENIEDLLDNPFINKVREGFKGDWKKPGCIDCVMKENAGVKSKRQISLERPNDGIRSWDIRPGNTCNLKCIMCNPWNSSKWNEDLHIFNRFYDVAANNTAGSNRKDLDWDFIYKNCADKAYKVYIAGGEPFYMKQVQKFLEKLSNNEWNCKYTEIQIQTNGVSNTPRLLKTLKKFNLLSFSVSVDGWHKVNELIRYPTNHQEWRQNVNDLSNLKVKQFEFNVTVQALNLPNIDILNERVTTIYNAQCTWNKLKNPNYLSINSLKPHIIQNFLDNSNITQVKEYCNDYEYSDELNKKMQNFLLELDAKRGTNSKKILPWCFE